MVKKTPMHLLFLCLHNKAASAKVIKYNRLYFQLGLGQLLTMSIAFTFKCLFHPASLKRVVSWLAFVIAIFMAHENDHNKSKTGYGTCKAC